MKTCFPRSKKSLSSKPVRPGIYRHYKGKYYEVLGEAHHSETLEELVVYRALYLTQFGRKSLWVRPRAMFLESISLDGKSAPRFRYVGKSMAVVKRKGVHSQ